MIPTTERTTRAEELDRQGLDWLLGQARETGTGGGSLAWPYAPSAEGTNPGLYYGTSGIVLALLEGWHWPAIGWWSVLIRRTSRICWWTT